MSEKVLNLKESLYDLTTKYPELISILKNLGFAAITNPIARNTLGRKMTIPAGCEKQRISLDNVINELKQQGFTIENV